MTGPHHRIHAGTDETLAEHVGITRLPGTLSNAFSLPPGLPTEMAFWFHFLLTLPPYGILAVGG